MPKKAKKPSPEETLLFCLQHPLRKQLLRLFVKERGDLSPKELTIPTNRDLSKVGYHVRVLAEQGAVELVDTQPRRGAVEHFTKQRPSLTRCPGAERSSGCRRHRDQNQHRATRRAA